MQIYCIFHNLFCLKNRISNRGTRNSNLYKSTAQINLNFVKWSGAGKIKEHYQHENGKDFE